MVFGKMGIKAGRQAAVLGVLMMVSLIFGGCALAREELENPRQDRMVGIFLTTEYLRMEEPEIGMSRNGEFYIENSQTQIEGTLGDFSDESFLQFEGVEGYGIYSIRMYSERDKGYSSVFFCDEIFGDLHLASVNTGEKIEATVYVGENGPRLLYFNPVYQREDGTIYLRQGTGLSWDGFADGAAMSRSGTESVSEGKKGEETVESFEYTIRIEQKTEPQDTELLFLDGENQVLERREESRIRKSLEEEGVLEVPQGTEYLLLVQSGKAQGQEAEEKRSLCNRGEEHLEFLLPGTDGFLEAVQLQILWQ